MMNRSANSTQTLHQYVRIALIALFILGCGTMICSGQTLPGKSVSLSNNTHTVKDFADRTVTLPVTINRVAALVGPSYEKIFLLGQADKMAVVPPFAKEMPWAAKIIPNLSSIPDMSSFYDPNIEELMNLKADAVFFWDYSKNLEKMEEANIPVVVTQLSSPEREPTSITAFKDTIKDEVKLFGTVLGSDATKRAGDYCTYFDEKTDKVLSVTSKIPDKDRVKVYYIAGDDALTTYGKNTYTQWWVEMAGGKLVSADIDDQAPQVSIEQVISWNPDYIMMGRVNSTDMVLHDSKWNDLKAVKEGHVYVCPQGVFYWDYSSEGILLMEYLAKTFYPEKFADLDMTEEVKEYYKKFYNYSLTDDQADLILKHLPPTKE